MKLFYCLLTVVFVSPLPFGSNIPWAWSLCSLLVAILGIIWAIQFIFNRQTPFFQSFKSISDIVIVFFIIVIWIVIQASHNIFTDLNHPLWLLQSEATIPSLASISLTPADTLISLMRLTSYALVFWLSLCYSQNINRARLVFYNLMVVGFIYSAYGLIIYLGDFKMILWREMPGQSSLISTFVNRNHFATFAGLSLLCTLALINNSVTISAKYNSGGNIGLQRFIENLIMRTWFPLLSFIIIGTALLLTYSRGGFFSSLLGLIVLLTSLNINRNTRNTYVLGGGITLIIVGGLVFYISSAGLLARLDAGGLSDSGREIMRELTWTGILSNPWLGFGLGSFKQAFTLYKSLDIAGSVDIPLLIDYAHNTYVETIFELGFPAAIALFYCFLRLAGICLMGLFIRKKDWIYPAVGLSATCLIATHAYVDFSMQIPAVPYTYALLMGTACAQSYSSKKTI